MAEQKFLGTGLKFPVQVNKATGRFLLSSGKDSVKESIYLILMTQKTERFVRPDFGSNILSYTFMDVSPMTLAGMQREISSMIRKQEPRVSYVDVNITPALDQGRLIVDISYQVAEDNTRDNLVFPFYLQSSENS